MKAGDIILHCKRNLSGVILTLKDDYAEVLWVNQGMYRPELIHVKELELLNG